MSLEVILQNLVNRVPRVIGAVLVDWEGEAVMDRCNCDPYEIRFIAAHKGIILARLKELQSSAGMGAVEDIVVSSGKGHLMIGCIDQDYSLVMSIERESPVALALYQFRLAIIKLRKEI